MLFEKMFKFSEVSEPLEALLRPVPLIPVVHIFISGVRVRQIFHASLKYNRKSYCYYIITGLLLLKYSLLSYQGLYYITMTSSSVPGSELYFA